jgi:FAD/FMN-containing dehydrogenase
VTGAVDPDLARHFGSRLLSVEAPVRACVADPQGAACAEVLNGLRNPYFIEEQPGGYHTTGWFRAFDVRSGPHAVAVRTAEDIADTVRYVREHGLRLAVKGTGHDYLGRSSAPDALMLWTHLMRRVTVHAAFTPAGAPSGAERDVPAVSAEAGARWLEVYRALTPHRRLALGGGCTTVGAAGGFVQGGGFGSFSKVYGTAAGNVIEMEVVSADGAIVVANAHRNADLFWALRGGGGGTYGVVSRVTYRTHPMPDSMSALLGRVRALSPSAYRQLLRAAMGIMPDLATQRWGEGITLMPGDTLDFLMLAPGLSAVEAQASLRPLLDWIRHRSKDFEADPILATVPFEGTWDDGWREAHAPETILRDERPGGSRRDFWWSGDQDEVSIYWDGYQSRWIPQRLFDESPDALADVLFDASRIWPFLFLRLNKGLARTPAEARERDRATSINPVALDAGALLIAASGQQYAFPGVPGHEPDRARSEARARRIGEAMTLVRAATPGSGSYVNEADFFEPDWQRSFWGDNYRRLLEIKRRYDPTNLFRVHHGVGSEEG